MQFLRVEQSRSVGVGNNHAVSALKTIMQCLRGEELSHHAISALKTIMQFLRRVVGTGSKFLPPHAFIP
jgi:hypothetical protein